MAITLANVENVNNNFIKDLKEALQYLKKNPPKQGEIAAFYGANAQLPNAEMGEEMIRSLMRGLFK